MITSIVLTDKHHVSVNSNKKIKVDGNILSIEKDIPFVRYRFNTYGEEEFAYIKDMMNVFNYSTHLIEINLADDTEQVLEYLAENITNIARYVYVDVTDIEVENRKLSEEVLDKLDIVADFEPDRYVLRDKSTKLDTISAKAIIKDTSEQLDEDSSLFGVCSSPLSFGEWACLTAVRARELMSLYSTVMDVALPTANHQCMNCCGCIRYLVIDKDTDMVSDGKVTKTSKVAKVKKDNTDKEVKETKPKKVSKAVKPMVIGEFDL